MRPKSSFKGHTFTFLLKYTVTICLLLPLLPVPLSPIATIITTILYDHDLTPVTGKPPLHLPLQSLHS